MHLRRQLSIVGLQRLSLIDFPGRLCATVFTAGCNFRCPYCQNVDLVLGHQELTKIPEREVLDLLNHRRGFLDGLCVGGGEPTLHRELSGFLYRVKSLGYSVKLDTNGSRPKILRKLMDEGLVDYVAMDIKAPLRRYAEVVRFKVDVDAIRQSIKMLRRGGIDYEFRTTVVPRVLSGEDIEEIAKAIVGSKRYALQQFRPGSTLCPEFSQTVPYSIDVLEQFRSRAAHYFGECILRA